MTSINKHVDQFLEYYYGLEVPPEYSVLIKGSWGVGKSWFIKKTLKKLKEQNGKSLYVSLYGLTSFTELESLFFEQLHPVLSSKGMKLTSKILKGVLKATIKVDLDGDGKADGSVSAQIPDLNIPEYLQNTDGFVLVFDDLERCSMNIGDVLGYINQFVEHQGFKVVIVANEDEVIKQNHDEKNGSQNRYLRIKEKLIGKTFDIESDVSGALKYFIGQFPNGVISLFYQENFATMVELYNAANYNNLRHLKQVLWDFERLCKSLPDFAFEKDELMQALFGLYLAYSFEIKSGRLETAEIGNIHGSIYDDIGTESENTEEKSLFSQMSAKYPMIDFGDPILDETIWFDVLDRGFIDAEKVKIRIENSRFYIDENTPNWIKLWYMFRLNDTEFEELIEVVKLEIANNLFDDTDIHVVKHLAGMFLNLADLKLIDESKQQIYTQFCEYVDYLYSNDKLPVYTRGDSHFLDPDCWQGLGFSGTQVSEFQDFCLYLDTSIQKTKSLNFPDTAVSLLDMMKSDIQMFHLKLTLCNHEENIYYETAILHHIGIIDFIDTLLMLDNKDARQVCYTFKERYGRKNFLPSLIEELDWLHEVRKILIQKSKELKGKLSGYKIERLIRDYFDEAISAFDTVIDG